ncbi:MAG: hypothetical protein Q8Q56_04145 [Alphaproteobacteria bacterium]|nr:hypothetical protein [Alphaproteobacteria bacterium]
MLHKHPSAEKAQVYFGITEKLKHDAANFFIYIQPKMGHIYDSSVYRALGEHHNLHNIRDTHLTHLSTLLTGGIDHRFIDESHRIRKKYADHGITTGEYIKLYQLIISYLSGEAHKKHWWRYKKYRDLNRAIRNLLLFDLAIGTSPKELESSAGNFPQIPAAATQTTLLIDEPAMFHATLEELSELVETSHTIINECYQVLQSVLEFINQSNTSAVKEEENNDSALQRSLFANDSEYKLDLLKSPSNQNDPALAEILSIAYKKISKISKIISMKEDVGDSHNIQTLEKMLNDVQHDIEKISTMDVLQIPQNINGSSSSKDTLYNLLQKSSTMIGSHLNNLKELKAKKLYLK